MMNNTLGKTLKAYRRLNNLSQEELGRIINKERQTISTYEIGLRIPNIYTLCDLADLYGISLDELIGRQKMTRVWLPEKKISEPE